MASIRNLKKDLTYLVNEVISDAYVALYFQPESARDAIFDIVSKAADLNNTLLDRINHPAEKHNPSLVRKHYAQIRRDMTEGVETLFGELSQVCKASQAKYLNAHGANARGIAKLCNRKKERMKIRLILCSLAAAVSAFVVSGCGSSTPKGAEGVADNVIVLPVPEREPGQTDVLNLVTEPMDTVRVAFVGLGMRGSDAVRRYTYIPGVKIVALCDVYEDRVKASNAFLQERGFPAAQEFYGDTASWRQMVAQPDVDLVYICTGWDWHTPIAVQAMKEGKHVAIEVPAAMSIDECWELVNTAEKTRKHCMMLENCVYDNFEMATLNMAQQGLFGEVVHVEGAYLHDLRSMNFALKGEPGHYADMWRLKQNTKRTGDIYPTHGLGPIAQILGIHRGDRMKTLVSMNTDEFGMTEYAKQKFGDTSAFARTPYRMGDHTTTLIRTEKGKTMMVQHDVTNPRPYSRIHQVSGTKGFAQKYPMEGIALEADNEALPANYQDLSGHSYVSNEMLATLLSDYEHPVIKQVGAQAQEVGGHGGMDFVMDYRLIYCLRNGLPLDMDVYDAAEMSCLTGLSELSIENGSAPVAIPDFTRGAWNRLQGQAYVFTPADSVALGLVK